MNLVERAKNILLTPAKEWAVIKGEQLTIVDMFTKYAMLLAAIPAVAGFIGYSLIGVSYGFGTFRVPIGTALVWAILQYILSLAGVFLIAFIMDALAPTFGCSKNLVAAVKIVVFSYTAAWVAGILNIIPSLGILVGIASIYSLYLMYMGLQIVKDVPKDKMVGYFVVTIIAAVVVFVVIGIVVGAVAFGSMSTLGGFRTM
ncbi:MAG: Yip1 family protein [Candidatus Aminicenantes bacterium]|nr:Yip1 family protein [Candidatus Aminicenantes bacterium]